MHLYHANSQNQSINWIVSQINASIKSVSNDDRVKGNVKSLAPLLINTCFTIDCWLRWPTETASCSCSSSCCCYCSDCLAVPDCVFITTKVIMGVGSWRRCYHYYVAELYEKCFITTRCTFTVTNETHAETHTHCRSCAGKQSCVSACHHSHTHICTITQTRCLAVGHCVGQAQTGRFVCTGRGGAGSWPGIQSELWNVDKTFYCTPTPTHIYTLPLTHANKSYQCGRPLLQAPRSAL